MPVVDSVEGEGEERILIDIEKAFSEGAAATADLEAATAATADLAAAWSGISDGTPTK